jgi:hypothetical protein
MRKSYYRLLEEVFDIEKRKQILSIFENFRNGNITEHDFVEQLEEFSQVLSRKYAKGRLIPSIKVAKDASYVALVDLPKRNQKVIVVSERVLSELGSEVTTAAYLYYLGAAIFYSRWKRFLGWSVIGAFSVSGLSFIISIVRALVVDFKVSGIGDAISVLRDIGRNRYDFKVAVHHKDEWFKRFYNIFRISGAIFLVLGLIWIFGNIFSKGLLSKDKFFVYKLGFAGDLAKYFDYMKKLLTSYVSDTKLMAAMVRDSFEEYASKYGFSEKAPIISAQDLLKGFKKFIKKQSSRLGLSSEDKEIIGKQILSLEDLSKHEEMDKFITENITQASGKIVSNTFMAKEPNQSFGTWIKARMSEIGGRALHSVASQMFSNRSYR